MKMTIKEDLGIDMTHSEDDDILWDNCSNCGEKIKKMRFFLKINNLETFEELQREYFCSTECLMKWSTEEHEVPVEK